MRKNQKLPRGSVATWRLMGGRRKNRGLAASLAASRRKNREFAASVAALAACKRLTAWRLRARKNRVGGSVDGSVGGSVGSSGRARKNRVGGSVDGSVGGSDGGSSSTQALGMCAEVAGDGSAMGGGPWGLGAHCVRQRQGGARLGALAVARGRAWCRASSFVVAAGPCSRQGGACAPGAFDRLGAHGAGGPFYE